MNQRINQTGGGPTPRPLRYFKADAKMEKGCCGCNEPQNGGGCGCGATWPVQTGGNPTPLPMQWFNPNASFGLGSGCGCEEQSQSGGYAAPWPQPCFNQADTAGADCFCEAPPDFTNMLYRGKCARAVASGSCKIPVSKLQCLPAMYPVPHYPGDPLSPAELAAQGRVVGNEESQTGGGTVGAPFYNDTFGCAKGVPGVKGLSYRFNECGLQTGVNFYQV